jgi:predicted DNA-binding transcriptional regulator AlpA
MPKKTSGPKDGSHQKGGFEGKDTPEPKRRSANDRLPLKDRLTLRPEQAQDFLGIKHSRFWELQKKGGKRYDPTFPKSSHQVPGGRAVEYKTEELLAWKNAQWEKTPTDVVASPSLESSVGSQIGNDTGAHENTTREAQAQPAWNPDAAPKSIVGATKPRGPKVLTVGNEVRINNKNLRQRNIEAEPYVEISVESATVQQRPNSQNPLSAEDEEKPRQDAQQTGKLKNVSDELASNQPSASDQLVRSKARRRSFEEIVQDNAEKERCYLEDLHNARIPDTPPGWQNIDKTWSEALGTTPKKGK